MTSWNGPHGSRPPVVVYVGACHPAPAQTYRSRMTLAVSHRRPSWSPDRRPSRSPIGFRNNKRHE
jgi:hypothetical protein